MNENVIRDIDPDVGWATISSEMVSSYVGNRVFMAVDAKVEKYDYASDPIWKTIDAVKTMNCMKLMATNFTFPTQSPL